MNQSELLLIIVVLVLWWRATRRLGKRGCTHSSNNEAVDPQYPLTGNLYPLRHPLFCAREASKHCALLEDHLSDPHRNCNECERKHFLMLEGFLEEGLLMDKHQKFGDVLVPALEKTRDCVRRFVEGADGRQLAQLLREIRKPLSDRGFAYFS